MAEQSTPFNHDDHDDGNLTRDSDARDTTGEAPKTPDAPAAAETPEEGAAPPGYDWPTHGGYLGCLLSLMASCLIGGFLGTTLFAALGYSHAVPKIVAAVLTVLVYVGVTVGLGRLGWILGKRFYREYPQTRVEDPDQSLPDESVQLENGSAPRERDSVDGSEAKMTDSSAVDTPVDTR